MGLENFKKKAENDLEQSKKGIDNLLDFAKPKAEVKTESNYAKDLINQITYEVPEGMTEEVAIAVALGVLADNKLLRGLVTGSTAMALSTDAFNRSYMFMNALHGDPKRADQFYFVMPKARELARQAFEKYKSGDKSDIERYAENVMRVADELVLGHISEKEGSNAQSFVCKCADTLYKNGYGKAAISSQVNLDKLRSRVAFQELKREALIQSIRFADLFSEADSLEREEALLTIMAEKSINNNNLLFQKIETEIGSIAEEHFSEELEDPEKGSTISIEQRSTGDAMNRNVLFPDEFMFADPQRKAVYVDAVKKYIRTTDNFKKLLEADEKQFEENFNSLSKVRLTEAQIYEMLGEENRKMFELENQSNAGKQDAIRNDFIQHTKERAEEWVRQEKQREKAENAIYRKNADAIQKTLLSNLKKIYGDEAGEQEILFYVDGDEISKLEAAVKNVLEGRSIYLKQPGSGIMVQLTPKNQKNGKISLEKSETTAFRYSGEQAVNNIYTMKRNVELARKITLPHKFGSLPAMEKLSFCKRQLVDAAHGIDMGADYRAVIDAIEGVEQYYQGLHAPKENGTYPVFEAGDKERLQRAFDSVLQMVSEYQKVNLTGMVMDAVKDAAQEGQRYLDELQLDERKMSLKDRIVMQEPSNINIREICETNSKKLKEVYDALSQTEGFFHGSKQQYKDMKQALERLVQAGKEEPDTAHYQTLLNNMRDAVNNYIDYKKDDLGSDTSRSRYALAGQLKQLTAIARKEFFEGLEMQNEWDLMDVNRKIAKAAESPVEPELLEQLQSISGSLKENLASADKRIMTQQKEGITKELQKDMIKYAATVQKIAKSLDQAIPKEEQGTRAELNSKLHAFAGKLHPTFADTCGLIQELKETMQAHQTELTDSADPMCRHITELVTNHESHFADLKLAKTEQYMMDGDQASEEYLGKQEEFNRELLSKQAEMAGPTA